MTDASGILIAGVFVPWTAINTGLALVTAIIMLLVRSKLNAVHLEFNSKMDAYIKAVAAQYEAIGVLKEKERATAAKEGEANAP